MKREPKQSQLDYLWVNFGERGVVTSSDSDNLDGIPSYGLIQELISSLCSKAVGSVTQSGNSIIIKSVDGFELNRINIAAIGDNAINGFGRRKVTQEDINNKCPYPLNSYIYYIRLNNGEEFTAPTNNYSGGDTKVISNTILDDTIYSDLKISTKVKGVIFSKEDDGLSGSVYLENSTQGIRFSVVTQKEYDNKVHDSTTVYFIKDEPYLYFGDTKMGGDSLADLQKIELRLTNLENLLNWEENG